MIHTFIDAGTTSYMILTPEDAGNLLAILNRALNTWDPAERPKGMLDLCDQLQVEVDKQTT